MYTSGVVPYHKIARKVCGNCVAERKLRSGLSGVGNLLILIVVDLMIYVHSCVFKFR